MPTVFTLVVHHSDDDGKSFLGYADPTPGGPHGQTVSRDPDCGRTGDVADPDPERHRCGPHLAPGPPPAPRGWPGHRCCHGPSRAEGDRDGGAAPPARGRGGPGGRLERTPPRWGATHAGGQAGSVSGRAGLSYASRRAAVPDEARTSRHPGGTEPGRVDGGGERAPPADTHGLKPWLQQAGCLPTGSAARVWRREAVLDLYAEPADPQYPGVCGDASPAPWSREVRQPGPVAPGQPVRHDDAYRWEGPCHGCMGVQPWGGWRHLKVTARRTAQACAYGMKDLVDRHVPEATLSSVVREHVNTPTPAALCHLDAGGSPPHSAAAGWSLDAQAWRRAPQGGHRRRGAVHAGLGPPDPGPRDGASSHHRRGSWSACRASHRPRAVHHPEGATHTQAPLPLIVRVVGH